MVFMWCGCLYYWLLEWILAAVWLAPAGIGDAEVGVDTEAHQCHAVIGLVAAGACSGPSYTTIRLELSNNPRSIW